MPPKRKPSPADWFQLPNKVTGVDLSNKAQFTELLRQLDHAYHNGTKSLVTDAVYDDLVERYNQRHGKYTKTGAMPAEDDDIFDVGQRKPTASDRKKKEAPSAKADAATEVGNRKVKCALLWEMPSLDKAKEEKELQRWRNVMQSKLPKLKRVVVSHKVDGMSGLLDLTDSSTPQLFTRGNGRVGFNVSHLLKYVRGVPPLSTLTGYRTPEGLCIGGVRLELVLTQQDFLAIKADPPPELRDGTKLKNARGTLIGIVNAKTLIVSMAKRISVVAYEVFYVNELGTTPTSLHPITDHVRDLQAMGFVTPDFEEKDYATLDLATLTTLTEARKLKALYQIDGVVLWPIFPQPHKAFQRAQHSAKDLLFQNDNDDDALDIMNDDTDVELPWAPVAFKIAGEKAVSRVLRVTWKVTRFGDLAPKVWIVPVQCGDIMVEKTTGHSGQRIRDWKIGVGALVRIEKRGDVIPNVVGVLEPSTSGEPDLPADMTPYKWNDAGSEIVVRDRDCPEVKLDQVVAFFKHMKAAGIGKAVCQQLCEHYDYDLARILSCTVKELLKLKGFKETKAKNTHDSIHKCINHVPLVRVMVSCSQFGPGFGDSRFQQICDQFGGELLDWHVRDRDKHIEQLRDLGGLKELAVTFVDELPTFQRWLQQHPMIKYVTQAEEHPPDDDEPARVVPLPKAVCFSGCRVPQWELVLRRAGSEVKSSVTKKTEVLVMKALGSGSAKEEKAKELGIPVLTLAEFANKYAMPHI